MNANTIIVIMQAICFMIGLFMYIPQIVKTHKLKTVGDISVIYNVLGVAGMVLSCIVLELVGNSFIVVFGQYNALFFSSIILMQIIYYSFKGGNKKPFMIVAIGIVVMAGAIKMLFAFVPSDQTIVYMIQAVTTIGMFIQSPAQIIKTYKLKTVKDISLARWMMGLIANTLGTLVVVIAGNPLVVILPTVINLTFNLTISLQCLYYGYIKQ